MHAQSLVCMPGVCIFLLRMRAGWCAPWYFEQYQLRASDSNDLQRTDDWAHNSGDVSDMSRNRTAAMKDTIRAGRSED